MLGKDMFLNEDSIIGLKKIKDDSIDAIISDIPYGIGYAEWDILHSNKNKGLGGSSKAQQNNALFKRRGKPLNGWSEEDKNISKEYQDWVMSWSQEWLRVMKPGGSVFVFSGRQYSHRVITAFEDTGFTFKDSLSWERNTAPFRAQRLSKIYERREDYLNAEIWNGWRVANLRPIYEPILWFQKPYKLGTTLADNVLKYDVGAWNENALLKYNLNKGSLKISNMIKVTVSSNDRGIHVTQKPLNLMKLLTEMVTKEGQWVLDPFSGSGTTLLAAKELNRHYIGFEIDPTIYIKGAKRLL